MTSTRLHLACLIGCLGAALACEKAEPPTPPPVSEPAVAPKVEAAPIAPVTTAARVELETVPTEEDFEQEAQTAITPANLEQQLEALEKEVTSE